MCGYDSYVKPPFRYAAAATFLLRLESFVLLPTNLSCLRENYHYLVVATAIVHDASH